MCAGLPKYNYVYILKHREVYYFTRTIWDPTPPACMTRGFLFRWVGGICAPTCGCSCAHHSTPRTCRCLRALHLHRSLDVCGALHIHVCAPMCSTYMCVHICTPPTCACLRAPHLHGRMPLGVGAYAHSTYMWVLLRAYMHSTYMCADVGGMVRGDASFMPCTPMGEGNSP
jgi:hypothetical protein